MFGNTNRRDVLRLVGSGIGSGIASVGTALGTAAGQDDGQRTFVLGVNEIPPSAPFLVHTYTDYRAAPPAWLAMDTPLTITPEFEPLSLLVDIDTDDGQVYELELRDGLEWSDPYGRVTAEDVVYYIREIHQAEDNWTQSESHNAWTGIEVEALSDRTVELRLPEIEPDFWPFSRNRFMPKELIEPYVDERDLEGLLTDREVRTVSYAGNLGPYRIEHVDDSTVVAVRNEHYYARGATDLPSEWRGAPYFDRFEVHRIDDRDSRLDALAAGELTAAPIVWGNDQAPPRIENLREDEGVNVVEHPEDFVSFLAYNQRTNGWDPLRQRDVRRALGHAIDKEAILVDVFRDLGEVVHTPQASWSPWHPDDLTEFGVEDRYDHDLARDLLADALSPEYGYDEDGRLRDSNGEVVTLTLVATGTLRSDGRAARLTTEYDAIGINLEIEYVDFPTLINHYATNEWIGDGDPPWWAGPMNAGPAEQTASRRDWDLMHGIAFNTYPHAPARAETFWHERAPNNFMGYRPEQNLGTDWEAVRGTLDREKRQELLADVFQTLNEDQPANFILVADKATGYRANIAGPEDEYNHIWDRPTWRSGPGRGREDPPGQDETPPGRGGSPPSRSGSPPGHGGSPPGRDDSVPRSEVIEDDEGVPAVIRL